MFWVVYTSTGHEKIKLIKMFHYLALLENCGYNAIYCDNRNPSLIEMVVKL